MKRSRFAPPNLDSEGLVRAVILHTIRRTAGQTFGVHPLLDEIEGDARTILGIPEEEIKSAKTLGRIDGAVAAFRKYK